MRSLFVALHRGVQKYRISELTKATAVAALGVALFAQVAKAADPDPKTWAGIGWGLGVAADFDLGGKRVADAQIINGLVRIKDSSSNVGVSFVLETHYFFKEWLPKVGTCLGFNCNDVAIGPFIAIEIGGGNNERWTDHRLRVGRDVWVPSSRLGSQYSQRQKYFELEFWRWIARRSPGQGFG